MRSVSVEDIIIDIIFPTELKDNHIGAAGSVAKAVEMAKEYAPFVRKIEVEVENLIWCVRLLMREQILLCWIICRRRI